MKPIDEQMAEWFDMAAQGVPADAIMGLPDYDVYVRAFRLKHFYRCPVCDQRSIRAVRDDFQRMGWDVRCTACGWIAFSPDTMYMGRDDGLLKLVEGAPAAAPRSTGG